MTYTIPDTGTLDGQQLCLTASGVWFQFIIGALDRLTNPAVWDSDDETERAFAAQQIEIILSSIGACEVVPVGAIQMYAGDEAPEGWLLCNGASLQIIDYPDLYAVIGKTYNPLADAQHFNLPDMRGRSPLGAGVGPGLTSRSVGERVGAERVLLQDLHLPIHSHSMPAHTHTVPPHSHNIRGNSSGTTGGFATRFLRSNNTAAADLSSDNSAEFSTGSGGGGSTGDVGSGQQHDNMHPVLVVQYIIKAV